MGAKNQALPLLGIKQIIDMILFNPRFPQKRGTVLFISGHNLILLGDVFQ